MINIENEYKGLISEILNRGLSKSDRTGTGTKSVFGRTIRHDMSDGFPILTGKRISFNAARTELLWILTGRTDLKYLEDNGVNYWRPDYERSGRTDETLGPVYGKQWRDFNGRDQIKNTGRQDKFTVSQALGDGLFLLAHIKLFLKITPNLVFPLRRAFLQECADAFVKVCRSSQAGDKVFLHG